MQGPLSPGSAAWDSISFFPFLWHDAFLAVSCNVNGGGGPAKGSGKDRMGETKPMVPQKAAPVTGY